jgi:hypothetical protein
MSDLSLSLTADGSGLPSLFFRAADRLRLEGCVAAVCREGRSLALSSLHDAALDHYGQLLAARLRHAAPGSRIEVYFPANTAVMLERFNAALARQSLSQAMDEQSVRAPDYIWLVNDAGALAENELQLLASLVTNFPGSNIRVVLLLGPGDRGRKAFESFGRRILRWDIEAPTPEQAQAMLAQARTDGCEGLVSELLQKILPSLLPATAPSATARGALEDGPSDVYESYSSARRLPPATPFSLPQASSASAPAQAGGRAVATLAGSELRAGALARAALGSAAGALRGVNWRGHGQSVLGATSAFLRRGPRGWLDAVRSLKQRAPKTRWVLTVLALGLGSVAVASWLHPGLFSASKRAAPGLSAKDTREIDAAAKAQAPICWKNQLPEKNQELTS